MIKRSALLIAIFGMGLLSQMGSRTQAQIPAPDPICVSKDTLLWNLPNVQCGPIESYEIYVSNNRNGPYSLVTVILDTTQTSFYHENNSGETRYYYMQTTADCSVRTNIPSDTINNIPPPKVPISVVTVEGGNVRISWNELMDDQVKGYIIYKATSSGTVPIDTVVNASTYVDHSAAVNKKSEYYYVLSIDKCGNPSLFDITHRTIYVKAAVDSCKRTIKLNWNPYEGWGDNLDRYEVYRTDLQGNGEKIATLPSDSLGYTDKGILDNVTYCYEIKAYHDNGNLISSSQQLCLNPTVVQPLTYSNIYQVDVKLNGEIEVNWEWNSDAQLSDVELSVAQAGNDAVNLIPFNNLTSQNRREGLTDMQSDPGKGKLTYSLNSVDICDSLFTSMGVSSIFLTARSLPDFNVGLQWTEFEVKKASNVSYSLQRIVNNEIVETIPLNNPGGMHEYPFDPSNTEIYRSCYRIEVEYDYRFEDGTTETYRMHSNVACPSFKIQIQVPNAMVYQGVNDQFKPIFLVPQLIDRYEMEIFSRNGESIFLTDDITEGWDGTVNGRVMAQGVYVYKITASRRGKRKTIQGHFTLLH